MPEGYNLVQLFSLTKKAAGSDDCAEAKTSDEQSTHEDSLLKKRVRKASEKDMSCASLKISLSLPPRGASLDSLSPTSLEPQPQLEQLISLPAPVYLPPPPQSVLNEVNVP